MKTSKKKKTLISIIVATHNSENTIADTLDSVKNQIFKNYEVIIIDKKSTDNTIKIVKTKKIKSRIYIGRDTGVYDAINKGIVKSKGSIISILHSDDYYYDRYTLEHVIKTFQKYKVDIVYGNLLYVKKSNKNFIIRTWISSIFKNNFFLKGWSPPHPTFFCKKKNYLTAGLYNKYIGNSADIELMHRFLQIQKFKFHFLNKFLVVMRYGGMSNNSIKNIIQQNLNTLKFLKIFNNPFLVFVFFAFKIYSRINQIVFRK